MTEVEKISEELAEYGVPDELIGENRKPISDFVLRKKKTGDRKILGCISRVYGEISMEIRKVSDNVAIYSDGKRLQVIHNLGDEFILDFNVEEDSVWNLDGQVVEIIDTIEPVFKVCGFCSKAGEDMQRLKHAILQFEEFEQYIRDNQDELLDWRHKPGRKENE